MSAPAGSFLLILILYFTNTNGTSLQNLKSSTKLHKVRLGTTTLLIGPEISENGRITLYTLDASGTFHRCTPPDFPQSGEIVYSVLKNGILVPTLGPYPIIYEKNQNGDLMPKSTNHCVYASEKETFYIKGVRKMLIPVEVFYSGDQIYYVFGGHTLLFSEPMEKSLKSINLPGFSNTSMSIQFKPDNSFVVPEKSCSGDITLFLLKSNGVFARNPPDEYLPNGMKLQYELKDDGSLTPHLSRNTGALALTYETAENGNLKPCDSNTHALTTMNEMTKSYILAEGGVLAPVSEIIGVNKSVSYFFDGRLIHSSNQFRQMFSNSSVVYLTEKSKDTEIQPIKEGPKFICTKRISKREIRYTPEEDCLRRPVAKCENTFAYDDAGRRIALEPLVNENGQIALYKLTCKGHLKRVESYKEPESGFEVQFKLLDNCILLPTSKNNGRVCLRYTLQENGNLAPVKNQKHSLKKAPASVVYYCLAKCKALIPVRLNILKDNHIELYYQDCLIYSMPPECSKDLEVFTTLYSPLYVYLNGYVTIVYVESEPKPCKSGATWNNPNRSNECSKYPTKNLYLVGPDDKRIKIEVELNQRGVPCCYDMDWNGVCHKSPKDDNKNMILRSYKLLKDGMMIPTKESNGYIYLVDKQGNMMPYCYPESKLHAPYGLTVKYVCCKEGVLIPVLVEADNDYIRFSFESNVLYCKKAYTIDEILELCEEKGWPEKKDDTKYFKEKDGSFVYFERIGDVFYRHPCQMVQDYIMNHSGYLKVLPCGTLVSQPYPEPKAEIIKVQINGGGNLLIVAGKAPTDKDYLLAANGDLIPVEIEKSNGYCKFYRNGVRVGKQDMEKWKSESCDNAKTPSGKDPLGLMDDPAPKKSECKEPHHVIIPIDEVKPNSSKYCNEHERKCQQIRKSIKELVSKDPDMLNMEMKMEDEIVEQIYNLVCECAKGKKSKRDLLSRIQRHLGPMQEKSSSEVADIC